MAITPYENEIGSRDGLESPTGISPLGINSAMSATNSTTRE